ncbi:MAG: response regulator [Chloroflexi bacterium]|nr:response regulator [Chloroflexota bacterium]
MARGRKVLIVEHVPDLLTLIDTLLRAEGYRTHGALMGEGVMDKARKFAPDVILLDMMGGHPEDVALLDQLRTDADTRGTPVVAMGTLPGVLEKTLTSYNVRQVVLKPFDVDTLIQKTRAALEGSPLLAMLKQPRAPVKRLFSEVAAGLATISREMMVRWVQRVAASEPFRGRKLGLAAAIDQVPILLEVILVALQSEDFRRIIDQDPTIRERVAEHVQLRRQQGIPLAGIVQEYQFLREEIRCEIAGVLGGKGVSAEDTLEVVTRKDYALDTIIRLTVETYEREAGLK